MASHTVLGWAPQLLSLQRTAEGSRVFLVFSRGQGVKETVQVAGADAARTAALVVVQWHQASPQRVWSVTLSAGSQEGSTLFTGPGTATGKAARGG